MTKYVIHGILKILTQEKLRMTVDRIGIRCLVELAEDFGLSCIEDKDSVTVVGETKLLIFTKEENNQCQLTEIY